MLKVGITGSIASGKTTISILIRRRSFAVFNADNYAKMARHKGNECFEKLVGILGNEVVGDDGDIDARKMADKIFCDEALRKQVNAIVHPFVIRGMEKFFSNHESDLIAFAEVPLLFEAHLESYFDKIIVVSCDEETAMHRMIEERDYTLQQAQDRYASQLDPQLKIKNADFVIANDGDLKALDSIVNKTIGQLRREARNGHQS